MLRQLKILQQQQRFQVHDRLIVDLEVPHQLSGIPFWGILPAYQDEEGVVRPAIATSELSLAEFWVLGITSSDRIEIIFEGILRIENHELIIDSDYYLSSDSPGAIVTVPGEIPQKCLYVIDRNYLRLADPTGGSTIGGATEAKQDMEIAQREAIVVLLQTLKAQTDLLTNYGTTQQDITDTAESTAKTLLSASGTRKQVSITNHSENATETVIVAFNTDAELLKGKRILPGSTYTFTKEDARSLISIISNSGSIPISYCVVEEAIFSIGALQITDYAAGIVDLTYPVIIVGATASLTAMNVDLFEDGNPTPIASQSFDSGLVPGAVINVVFPQVSGFNSNSEEISFYIEVTGS